MWACRRCFQAFGPDSQDFLLGITAMTISVMIEKNSLEIAKLLDDWMQKNVK